MKQILFGLQINIVFLFRGYSFANCKWIYKQAMLETGNLNSTGYNNDKNAFGMSVVRKRPTTQVGGRELSDGNTLGKYKSVFSSIKDRYMWDKYFKLDELKRSEDYPQRVSEKYHKSPAYASSVAGFDGTGYQNSLYLLAALVPTTYLLIKTFKK